MNIIRQPDDIARYTTIKHTPSAERISLRDRMRYRKIAITYNKEDGVNTLQYKVLNIKEESLYTHIKVNLQKERDAFYKLIDSRMK